MEDSAGTTPIVVALISAVAGIAIAAFGYLAQRQRDRDKGSDDGDRRGQPRGEQEDLVTVLVNDLRRDNQEQAREIERLRRIVEERQLP